MKHQALFSLKDKSKKKLKCRLLQFLFDALRIECLMSTQTFENPNLQNKASYLGTGYTLVAFKIQVPLINSRWTYFTHEIEEATVEHYV